MSEDALAALLSGYIDGDLEERERSKLANALEHDRTVAREFDDALHMEALLRAAHVEAPPRGRISAGVRARMKPALNWWIPAFAAAAILAVVCGVWGALREDARPPTPRPVPTRPDNELLSGSLLVAGKPAGDIPNGSRVTVPLTAPATVKLSDGSRAKLMPRSTAVLRGPADGLRQVVALEEGKALFNVERGARQFRVDTSIGKVTVTGTKFSVELKPRDPKGEGRMKGKLALAMIVAVAAGSVSVEYDGRKQTLTAGQDRVFAAEGEKRPEKRKSRLPEGVHGFSGMVAGAVVAKGDKSTFTFKITKVLKTWKGNRAKRPHALVGQTVRVGPRWEKRGRKWRRNELHVLFIRKLKTKHVMNLEIANHEGDHFSILELAGVQREWAKQGHREGEKRDGEHHEGKKRDGEHREGEKRDGEHREDKHREGEKRDGEHERPRRLVVSEGKSTARFIGVVRHLKKSVLYIKIEKIKGQTTWKHPKTGKHGIKAGSTAGFCAQWELKRPGLSPKNGANWQPSRREMDAFKKVRTGDRVECSAYFDEHPRLRVIEITGRGHEGEKREKEDRHREEKGRKHDERGEKEKKKEGSDDWDF